MSDAPNVRTKHPAYAATESQWQRCRDLIAGSDEIKDGPNAKDYLPQPAGMDNDDYEFYKERALYYNAMSRTVVALSGAVMRRPPELEVPGSIAAHLEDVTLRDEPLDVVALRIVTELLSVGRYGVLLDMPADAAENARPYWVTIPAERIINWRTARVGADPEQLVLVVIEEDAPAPADAFSHATTKQYRELSLEGGVYQSRVWQSNGESGEKEQFAPGPWATPMRRGQKLTFIPFTFIGTDGVTPDVTRAPLLDLADVAIAHYRNSADHEHGLFLVALPTPWASGIKADSKLKIGPSVTWILSDASRAGMLEFSGKGMEAIRQAMGAKERLMATLGARLLEDPTNTAAETATAVRMRHSGEAASLSTIAGAASAGLTRLARWHAWWFSGTGDLKTDITIRLCIDFSQVKASPEEVKTALLAVQAGKMSFDTFYSLLEKGGWTREGITAEDEKAQIETETPPPVDEPDPDDEEDDEEDLPPPGTGERQGQGEGQGA